MFRGDAEAMRARIAVLERQLADARDEADRARVGEAELDQLRREVELLREQREESGNGAKKRDGAWLSWEDRSARADPGRAPRKPTSKDIWMAVISSGLIVAALIAYLFAIR